MDWDKLAGLPLGPDWPLRQRRRPDGTIVIQNEPPNLLERFWAWPVGLVAFFVLANVSADPFTYFVVGVVLVVVWSELRMQTIRENHLTLCKEILAYKALVPADPDQ
jgi:hypothetical protein